jgi:2-C-methyl-D-erythritol 2,4-cyclodiphosphate synthase
MKIGQGIDAHRFSDDPTRPLWLGLVRIDGERGLEGHSDADVATHALCDALLGAANLGDLGRHFSDRDPAFTNVASADLLTRVLVLVRDAQFVVESADVTIVAERPRLRDYFDLMSGALTRMVGCVVSVKATTTEGMGALGRGEGIAANAVVLLRDAP